MKLPQKMKCLTAANATTYVTTFNVANTADRNTVGGGIVEQKGEPKMEKKNNIRSMRFSDRTIEIIEQQAGANFTQKFEALVTRCVWELPEAERQLERIQEQIRIEQNALRKVRDKVYEYSVTITALNKNLNKVTENIDLLLELE